MYDDCGEVVWMYVCESVVVLVYCGVDFFDEIGFCY